MKNEIIATLNKFEKSHYQNLYTFLDTDERAKPFQCYAKFVDTAQTLKQEGYPEMMYSRLCENDVKGWRIDPQLLLDALNV